MIRRWELSDRKPLSLPVVHPCPCVSPVTLLASLIGLSRSICSFAPGSFPTQRRNTREAVRIVGVLSVLFEEILGRDLEVSDITVTCLSEVHVALQQIQFLLEDCSRTGVKVWMLMKSRMVAAQFRVSVRGIVTALDALPLDSIGVDEDVREYVELVSKQAWKEKFEVDSRDDWANAEVHSILESFKVGIEPDRGVIKRVLDYLRIQSWNDCDDEISFFEEKIDSKCEKEVSFLSSLQGFMCYCRGVLFEFENWRHDVRIRKETFSCFHLDDFRCPISLELMTDPVTVSTGQTYDRSSIQQWLDAGNWVCPKTGQKLSSKELVANVAAKKLIQVFCDVNGIPPPNGGKRTRDINQTALPCSKAGANALRKLCRFLTRRLIFGSTEQKNNAAREVRLLTKSSTFIRKCLIDSGAVLPLLNLLPTANSATENDVIAALSKLAKQSCGKRMIINCCGLDPILLVLKKGQRLESRQAAAATIFYLSSTKGSQKLIGEVSDVIPALVDLIRDGRTCGKQNAIVTIFALLLHPENHQRVLDAGAVPLLINILASSDKAELLTDTLAVLAALSESKNGATEILETSGLPLITMLLRSIETNQGKEYCVSIMLSICRVNPGGKDSLRALAQDSTIAAALYSILTGGTFHAKKKVRALIKLLVDSRER